VLRELKGVGRGEKGGIEQLNETTWTCEVLGLVCSWAENDVKLCFKIFSRQPTKTSLGSHVVELPFPRSDYGSYTTGGVIQEVKKPKELSFKSLSQSLSHPGEFAMVDWAKMDNPAQSHIAWQVKAKRVSKLSTFCF
jgi:hypothetical protein